MKFIRKSLIIIGLFVLLMQLFSACMQMRTTPKKFYKAFEGKKHRPQLKTYTVNTHTIHYAEVGNPELPTVVMVHGAPWQVGSVYRGAGSLPQTIIGKRPVRQSHIGRTFLRRTHYCAVGNGLS